MSRSAEAFRTPSGKQPMQLRLLILVLVLLLFGIPIVFAQSARVTHVSDGDSFILASGERVRMIGVDAPELADPFGLESKQHLERLIERKTVLLERDPLNDDRDIHGRLLRFVTLDGIDINRQMIADGYAQAFLRYRFARERRDAYRDAEGAAKVAGIGMWASMEPPPSPVSTLEPESTGRPKLCGVGFGMIVIAGLLIARRLS